jgi:hypothetical protein
LRFETVVPGRFLQNCRNRHPNKPPAHTIIKGKKVKLAPEQAMKAQMGSRDIALLFL